MKLLQVCAFVSTLATLSASANGYSFSDFVGTKKAAAKETPKKESTGLTADEENRIFGGADADIDNYPYVASVRIHGVTVCAATLIAPQYLVTTAHCIKTDEVAMTASFDTEYSFGEDGELVKIVKGFKHPLYNKKKHLYDVGLFKLEKPSMQKIAALPAADGSDEEVGTMATVLGWGQTEESSNSFTLQQADLPIISNADCGKYSSYKNQLTEGMMCAGNGKGKGSCRGDAGGPLIADDALVGFVSWAGEKCGKEPGVYTRVSSVLDYINDIVAGGDGKKFGPAGKTSAVKNSATKASAAKTTKTSSTDASTGSTAAQKSPSTIGLTFSFDGSSAEQKTPATKASKTTVAPTTDSGSAAVLQQQSA